MFLWLEAVKGFQRYLTVPPDNERILLTRAPIPILLTAHTHAALLLK